MEVSGKYLPLVDPLTRLSPVIAMIGLMRSDSEVQSLDAKVRADHHHILYTREPDGQSPNIEFQ